MSEGLFSVLLDFGATAFNGDARYLEIIVRPTGGGGYTGLAPCQPITPAPYALFALKTKGYKNVVTVSPDGGDYTSVQAALTSITTSGTVTIDSSKVTASTSTIVSGQVGLITRVGTFQLSGGAVINNGTLTCSASYDENYVSPGLNICP